MIISSHYYHHPHHNHHHHHINIIVYNGAGGVWTRDGVLHPTSAERVGAAADLCLAEIGDTELATLQRTMIVTIR